MTGFRFRTAGRRITRTARIAIKMTAEVRHQAQVAPRSNMDSHVR
jgi:hypothetical protein